MDTVRLTPGSPEIDLLNGGSIGAGGQPRHQFQFNGGVIDNGIGPSGMPASKGILNDDEIWSIVQYIRHLPAKGSLGEPEVYNPK